MKTCYYDPTEVRQLASQIARKAGVSQEDADFFADVLVEADLHGTATHGISRLKIYMTRIQKGLIDPTAQLKVTQRKPTVLSVDAQNGLGQVQAVKTLDRLMPLAQEFGMATATIRQSQHFGALSYYCNRAAAKNMILLAMTNCEPAMSPAGGCEAFFGTNPIAVSFPTGKGYPVKIDLATSGVARGNIIAASKKKEPIPDHWALDADGNPTTDADKALLGTVLTMAGHKGYALAMMVELFSGVLSGAAVGNEIGSMYKDLDRSQNVGHFFCLMDVSAFMDIDVFTQRTDEAIDKIKACRRCEGVDEILVPGERSDRRAKENQKRGIRIDEPTLAELKSLCEQYQVTLNLNPMKELSGGEKLSDV